MSTTAFNTSDDTLSTALSSACATYDLAQVTEIVSSKQDNPSIERLVSGLIRKCSSGGTENAKLFKALAKYPHAKLNHAVTAEFLTKAIQSSSTTGDFSLWEAMLASGWDINTDLGHNGDATTISVMMDCPTVFTWLLDHGAEYDTNELWQPFSLLSRAAAFSSLSIVERLVAEGAQIKDSRALERAADYGRVEILKFLLEKGGGCE
jgi:hypothetical protein